MWWTIASGVIRLALNSYETFKTEVTAEVFPRDALEQLLAAVDVTRLIITREAQDTPVAEHCRGVMRITANFLRYDRCGPGALPEQFGQQAERLARINADAAQASRAIEDELRGLNLEPFSALEFASKIFTLYAALLPVRAAAMLERDAVCGSAEAAQTRQIFESAYNYANGMSKAISRRSDADFSPDYITRRGAPLGSGKHLLQYGFTHKGVFELVGEARPEAPQEALINRTRVRLQSRKEVAFQAYPGAAPVLQLKEYVRSCLSD